MLWRKETNKNKQDDEKLRFYLCPRKNEIENKKTKTKTKQKTKKKAKKPNLEHFHTKQQNIVSVVQLLECENEVGQYQMSFEQANYLSKYIPTPAAAPLGPRNTMGTLTKPADM